MQSLDLEISFVKNENRLMTKELIEHLKKYSLCYSTSTVAVENLTTSSSIGNDFTTDYRLFSGNDYVGHITFNKDQELEDTYEIHIVVFDEYKSKGIATVATKLAIDNYRPKEVKQIIATISIENSNREILSKLLLKNGFRWGEGLTFILNIA